MALRPVAVETELVWRVALPVAGALGLAAGLLYFMTAARDITFGDTPELVTAAFTLGVPHPPGYPLFSMTGWLFSRLPVDPLPFRISLLSVASHAATILLISAATYRFSRSLAAAVVAGVALASSPLFWRWSLVAEVFPLNDLLAASLLLVLAIWHELPARGWLLVLGGLLGGLALTAHQTSALLAPAALYLMWRRRDVLMARRPVLAAAAAAFVVGLLPYFSLLYFASLRPAWSWGDLQGAGDLLSHVLRQRYGSASLVNDPRFAGGDPGQRLFALLASFSPLELILLPLGAAAALHLRRWYATYLLIAFAFAGPAFAVYANIDLADPRTRDLLRGVLERFFLLPHVVVAPLAGFAVPWIGSVGTRLARPIVTAAVTALITGAGLALIAANYGRVDQSQNDVARRVLTDVFATLKPNSLFLAGGDAVGFPAIYLQSVEGVRPDVTLVAVPLLDEPWYTRTLQRQHPDLRLPAERLGPGGALTRLLIDANFSRPIALVGDLPDGSTEQAYGLYPRGLTSEIRRRDDTPPLDEVAAENRSLLAAYHPPPAREVDRPERAWERLALVEYARAYYRIGAQYESAADRLKVSDAATAKDAYARAAQWYRDALRVYPEFPDAQEGLRRLGN